MKDGEFEAIVVGAGIAGLSCAIELQKRGIRVLVLEAGERPGGRIQTDTLDGFRLDRGFQVLLSAYPQCQELLDYPALNLGYFEPGALIWNGRRLIRLSDPLRRPLQAGKALFNPVGSFSDKLRVGWLKTRLMRRSIEELYEDSDIPTYAWLRGRGFSEAMVEGFIRPFFSGIFLEEELSTSSRMFEFVFKMFSSGSAALPAGGMEAIPQQLAGSLEDGTLRCSTPVRTIGPDHAILESGEKIQTQALILATDMDTASRWHPSIQSRKWHSTTCLYFSLEKAPVQEPVILLNGSGKGIISNAAIPSRVTRGYAPEDRELLCISLKTGAEASAETVLQEFSNWLGEPVKGEFLRTCRIKQALPRQDPGDNAFGKAPLRFPDGVWVCGDYRYSASIEGAMASGRKVGQSVLED